MSFNFSDYLPKPQKGQPTPFNFADWLRTGTTLAPPATVGDPDAALAIEMMRQGRSTGWDGKTYNPPHVLSLAANPDDDWSEFEEYSPEAPQVEAPQAPPRVVQQAAPQQQAPAFADHPAQVAPQAGSPDQTEWRRTLTPGAATDVPADKLDAKNPGWIAFNKKLNELVNSDATDDQIRAFLAANPQFTATGVDEALAYRAAHRNREIPVNMNTKALPTDLYGEDRGKVDAFGLGMGDILTLGSKEELDAGAFATGRAIASAFGGGNGKSWSENYDERYGGNVDAQEAADYYHPYATNAGRVAGAVILPSVGVAPGAGLAMNAARLAAEGAVVNGVYGFNQDGTLSERLTNAGTGALSGAAIGSIAGATVGNAAARVEANRLAGGSEGFRTLQAAERLNAAAPADELIKPLPGHVGGMITRTVHNLQEPAITGGMLSGLAGASERYRANVGKALDRVAGDIGGTPQSGPRPVLSLSDAALRAGDPAVPGSMAHFVENFQSMARGPYQKAEQLAGNIRLATPRTVAKLDEIIARMRKVPGGVKGLGDLQELRTSLARGGGHDLQGLRDLRTSFGDKFDIGNRYASSAAKQLWPELSKDIFGGLRQAGTADAASAYRAADKAYAKNIVHLENIQKIIGKGQESSAEIAKRFARMGPGDAVRLRDAMQAIPPAMRGELQAAIVHNLGRKRAGLATSSDDWSISTFATGWNSLDEQARNALVPGKGHRADLDAIAQLANAQRRLSKTEDNPSGSARMLNNIGEATALGSAVLGGPVGWASLLPTLGSRWFTGLMLARPLLAKAMVKIGNSGVSEVSLKMLTRVARMEPAYSAELLGLRDKLANIVTDKAPVDEFAGMQEAPAEAPIADDEDWSDFEEVQ